ncbi:hypothetical protein [Mesorhizobium intechi]|uniref:hypothetical protein n=1 Tax=Mesorhizobium intechi TaxID=537601 RepID=UPI001FE9B485|nr:hypothetical protein [Mesorhizobium intechi]
MPWSVALVLGTFGIWLTIPFSTLLGWAYMSVDQVGESNANPFEGNAKDVPIPRRSAAISSSGSARGWRGLTSPGPCCR